MILTDSQFKKFMDSIKPQFSREEYDLQLTSFEKLKKNELPYILNIDHLAHLSGISPQQLHLFIKNKRIVYSSFKLPKKNGGFRSIDAPSKNMKLVQRWILDNILYKLNAGEYAHGFVPNRSIATNALVHVGQELVLGIDIRDFFPTITLKRVEGLFKSIGYNEEISYALGELCTFNWRLPQGAPTSPMISNLIAWRMDIKLSKFCEKRGLIYSRYADDITISGNKNLPRYKTLIFRIIEEEGFSINEEKVRLLGRGSSQKVTGVIVNDKISLGRKRRKRLEAIIHNILKNGPIAENLNNDPYFKEKLFGHLGFASMIEPDFALPLLQSLKKIDWEPYDCALETSKESELNYKSLSRDSHSNLIKFDNLGFFKDVETISLKWNDELITQLEELKEKCEEHSIDACKDCLHVRKELYEKCIKYILGHFVGCTCGPHHGHEVFDVGGETDLCGDSVFVAFLAKAGNLDRKSKDSLFHQFFQCTIQEGLDVISVVTPEILDNRLKTDLRVLFKYCGKEKLFCLIMRDEMSRILNSFQRMKSNNMYEDEKKAT